MAPAYDPARQSEFVELSASDIMECGPGAGEDLKVVFEKNRSGYPMEIVEEDPLPGNDVLETGEDRRGGSDDEGIGADQEGGGAVQELDLEQAKVAELDRDGWEVIQADAAQVEGGDIEEQSPPMQLRYDRQGGWGLVRRCEVGGERCEVGVEEAVGGEV